MPSLLSPSAIEVLAAQAGLSMAEVCRRAGIAQSTFTRWKAGRTEPTLDVYRKLCAAIPAIDAPLVPPAEPPMAQPGTEPGTISMPSAPIYGFAESLTPYRFAPAAPPDAEAQAREILSRIDRELLVEEARADRLLRAYSR